MIFVFGRTNKLSHLLMPTAHLGSGSMRCTTVESACELAVCWQLGVPPVVAWKRSKARYLLHGVQAQLGGSSGHRFACTFTDLMRGPSSALSAWHSMQAWGRST